jgi:glycolate oxidase iron-sulfur subunit
MIEEALAPGGTATPEMARHVERCLGCMACMTVCPEDVPYPDLLASARAAIDRDLRTPSQRLRRRAVGAALAHSSRLDPRSCVPHFTPADGTARGRVGLMLGCAQRREHREVHQATLAVLTAEGYDIIAPRTPDCCGATELHSGQRDHALRRARHTIDAFAAVGGVDHVISSAGSCGAALKQYGRLLGTPEAGAFSALVLDVHELLTRAPLRSRLGRLRVRIAYHDSCQLRHAQGVLAAPRELLSQIPGVELVELPQSAGACCGAPGVYRLGHLEAASALGRRQAQVVLETGAEMVVSGDHACIGQLARSLQEVGRPLAVRHPIEVLAQSISAGRSD